MTNPPMPSDDVLARIDAALDNVCVCNCGRQLAPDGPSAWFATEECQAAYQEHRNDPTTPSPDDRRRLAREQQIQGRRREAILLGDGWLSAQRGPVAWVRHCSNCRAHTTPEDAIRPVRSAFNWNALTPTTFQTERCNICSRCRSYTWPGPHLTAYYRTTNEEYAPGYDLRLESATHKAEYRVAISFLVTVGDRAGAWVWEELGRYLAELALPECVVPDCTDKGRMVFVAAEPGRLAGRDWDPGDQILLCPHHGHDVLRAHGAYGTELAEWMRPDATYDRLDAFDIGNDLLYGDQIRHSRARMLRLTRREPDGPAPR